MDGRIAVSTWSFHKHMGPLYGTEWSEKEGHVFMVRHRFPQDMSLMDFPRFVRERYGLGLVELCQVHFPSSSPAYLQEVKCALQDAGVQMVNLPIDVGNISQLDEAKREQDIKNIKRWMEAAAYLGSPCARVNSGHQPEGQEDIGITVASYRELADYAARLGIKVLLENHGGLSAKPENILKLVESVGREEFRLCPDFGNFDEEVRYQGLAAMFPYAAMAHAKTLDLDESGNERRYDFGRCMRIAQEAGYSGPFSIEYEDEGDAYVEVARSVALLRRYL